MTQKSPDGVDAKTQLNQFLSRKLRRSTTTSDLSYAVVGEGPGGFRATLTLHCLAEQQFAGERCANAMAAETSAAQQALNFYWVEIAQEPEAAQVVASASTAAGGKAQADAMRDSGNAKSQLNQFLTRKLGRSVSKADFSYHAVELGPGQCRATLTLPPLAQEFVGQARASAKDAEMSAAQSALDFYASEIAESTSVQEKTAKKHKKNKAGNKAQSAAVVADGETAGMKAAVTNEPDFARDSGNAKTQLNEFLPIKLGRPITKKDFTYRVVEVAPSQHQATLTLHCLADQQLAGEVCATPKDAQMSAAQQALTHYASEIAQHAQATGTKKKKKAAAQPPAETPSNVAVTGVATSTVAAPEKMQVDIVRDAGNPKSQLNGFLPKKLDRPLTRTDFSYHVVQLAPGQLQATLTLHCLSDQQFTGEACAGKKDAEMSAAQRALDSYATELAEQVKALKGKKLAQVQAIQAAVAQASSAVCTRTATSNEKSDNSNSLVDIVRDSGNAKSQLNHFLPKKLGRSVTKSDFSYNVVEVGPGQHRATLTLHSLGEQQFVGEPGASAKDAEMSAAQHALNFYATDITQHPGK